MSTELPPYLARPAQRLLTTFRVTGAAYTVELSATLHGRIHVHVAALPTPGRNYGSALTHDLPANFRVDEISLTAELMECMATPPFSGVPYFRAGFAVALEPGMRDSLADALVQLGRVADASVNVRTELEALLSSDASMAENPTVDSWNWMHGAVVEAIAAVWLDGETPAEAVDRAFEPFEKGSSWEAQGRVFRGCVLQAISHVMEERKWHDQN